MLRRIVKALVPSRGEVFYDLFIQAADNVHNTANLLADIINTDDRDSLASLSSTLKGQRQIAVDINKSIIEQLNSQFITPIDRGDIHQLAALMLKLTKRIIKINQKMQVYAINAHVDDCLIRSVNTLQSITLALRQMMLHLKKNDFDSVRAESHTADELDEKVIEDLGHATRAISMAEYDTVTIIKLKEVYKAIESAIETSATLCDTTMSISVKAV